MAPYEFSTPFSSVYTFQSTKSGFKLTKNVPSNGRGSASIIVTGIISPVEKGCTINLQYEHNGTSSGIAVMILLIWGTLLVISIAHHTGFELLAGVLPIAFMLYSGGISKKALRAELFILHADIKRILVATDATAS